MEQNRLAEYTVSFGDRTYSILLPVSFMQQLEEIAYLEDLSIDELCHIIQSTHPLYDLSEAIKSFTSKYYRNLALELPVAYSQESRAKLKKTVN